MTIEWDDCPVCPECGHRSEMPAGHPLRRGHTYDHDCEACGATYQVIVDVQINYGSLPRTRTPREEAPMRT